MTITCPQSELQLTSDCGLSIPFDPNAQSDYRPDVRGYEAIWDTGASYCAITQKVVDDLNLTVRKPVKTCTANGLRDTYAYLVNIYLPNHVMIPARWATLSTINGADILIGMDIISMGDFAVSRINENVKFTFQIPPTHDIDFDREKMMLEKYLKIHREWIKHGNNRCPCGNGKSWEQCHGKEI